MSTKGELEQTPKPWSLRVLPAQENHMWFRKNRRELEAEKKIPELGNYSPPGSKVCEGRNPVWVFLYVISVPSTVSNTNNK